MTVILALLVPTLIISATFFVFLIKRRGGRKGVDHRPQWPTAQPKAHLKDLNNALGREETHVVALTKAKTTIGRNPLNDIVIDKPTISSLHATIEFKNLAFYLEDQRSTNGTRLNNGKLQANMPVRLKNGDRIRFAAFGFMFVMPAQVPFGDSVMLSMTPLEGPEPGSTIVLDLDSTDGQQGLFGCLQNHLLQLYSLGAKYRAFSGKYFAYEVQMAIAEKAHDCLSQSQADGRQHCITFIEHQALYLICSLPVPISSAAEWYGAQYGGFTRFILQWLQSDAFKTGQCHTLCITTFGQDPYTWVSLTIVPTNPDPDPVEIMSVDLLNASEKALLALDFDRYGRVV